MSVQNHIESQSFRPASEGVVEQLEPGIRRQILAYGPDLMLCRLWFDTGAAGTIHAHPHTQATYVESGTFRIVIDGVERVMGAGDAVHVAPHLLHGSSCVEAGTLLDCFSPARADFLDRER